MGRPNAAYPTLLEPYHLEPKATVPALPLWGIFAVIKPLGPTSMSLLTRLKQLFSRWRLFVPEAEMDIPRMGSKHLGPTPTTDKKQLEKDIYQAICQISALGKRGGWRLRFVCLSLSPFHRGTSLTYHGSHWSGVRNEISGAIHRIHKGLLWKFVFFTGVINSFYE